MCILYINRESESSAIKMAVIFQTLFNASHIYVSISNTNGARGPKTHRIDQKELPNMIEGLVFDVRTQVLASLPPCYKMPSNPQ